ncbi:MAG: hypothetical protein J5685_05365 [Clostridiales bacterium]|nr:hypothetical protein [Clostridiales bacterium]
MWYLIMGGLLVFAGIYLLVKKALEKKKGVSIDARLTGFSDERGTHYPVFEFSYEGEQLTVPGGTPVEDPNRYKHKIGDTVNIIYVPGNTKYVYVVGSYMEILYGIGSIIVGGILLFLYFR